MSNSTVSSLKFDGAVRFNVYGEEGTGGFCRVCVPSALINGTFEICINGTQTDYRLLSCSNATHSYLYFTYSHSTKEIVIVPEFQSFLVPPIFMVATLLAVTVYKRKRSKILKGIV